MENELSLKEYLSIFKRRWYQVLAVFLLVMTIATVIIFQLPFVYRAEGKISIETSVIPDEIIKTTTAANYIDESIDKLKQKVFARENLAQLNKKYNLFPEVEDKVLEQVMGKSIIFSPETKDTSRNSWDNKQVTVGLVVGFDYSDPDTTYKVANEIIQRLLDENLKAKTKKATETTSFLTEELDRLKAELEIVENKVANYKQKHANSLPEHQEMHMASLGQLRAALKDLDREYKTTQEEVRYLEVEYATTNASLDGGGAPGELSPAEKLREAKDELERSMVIYTDSHPTIRALKRKVALLEQELASPTTGKAAIQNPAKELALRKIQTQIDSANSNLDLISSQRQSLNNQIATLQRQILQIPQVERGLAVLLRDYQNAKLKYEDVKSKQINAKIAENLTLGDKGDRFVLKQSPEFPKYRLKPQRTKLMAMSIVGSMVLAFALAFLLEMLDPRVRSQTAVSSLVGGKLLAVIPHIETPAEIRNQKNMLRLFSIGVVLFIVLMLIVVGVHFFVTPLNELLASLK